MSALFLRVDDTRTPISSVPGYPADATTSPNDYTSLVDGENRQVGVTKTLKVMAGDIIRLGTRAWVQSNTPPAGGTSPAETVLSAVLGMASGQVSSLSQHGVAAPQLAGSGSPLYGALSLFSGYNGASMSQPQAYLNWVLVDEQYGYVPEGSGYVQASSSTGLQTLATGEIEVVKSGYLTVFVSNQSSSYKAYFDNLSIEHRTGPLLAEDDYYPFGLTMAGVSSKAANKLENKYKFNEGTELNVDLGLNWYETTFRGFDPQTGRFHQVDPLYDINLDWSGYSFVQNNPLLYVDPLGLDTFNVNNIPASSTFSEQDVLIDDKRTLVGYWNGESWHMNWGDLGNVTVTANGTAQPNAPSISGVYVYAPNQTKSSFFDGDVSGQDMINVGVTLVASVTTTMQESINREKAKLYSKVLKNGLNSYYRRGLKGLEKASSKLGKIGKNLGYVGAGLSTINLLYKWNSGGGISRKDAFDGAISIGLAFMSFNNPWAIVALGIYGIMDSMGAFDGIKESLGIDDTIMFKRE